MMNLSIGSVYGRERLQSLFARMHRTALRGMNYGPESDRKTNGEAHLIRRVAGTTLGRIVVVDVGANIGDYAALAMAEVGDRLDLVCVEPSPASFGQLQSRLHGENVRLVNIGLGERSGEAQLYADAPGSSWSSLYDRRIAGSRSLVKTEIVQMSTLAQLSDQLGLGTIDLLKVDVEGGELAVLQGAAPLIEASRIRAIQFEFGGTHLDSRTYLRDFFELLTPLYAIHRMLPRGLVPLPYYSEELEIFLLCNYAAIATRPHDHSE